MNMCLSIIGCSSEAKFTVNHQVQISLTYKLGIERYKLFRPCTV